MDWCNAIVGIDPRQVPDNGKLRGLVADLRDPGDDRWIAEVAEADAVVHFAAQNPAPTSNWTEAAQSLDMTLNLLNRIARATLPVRLCLVQPRHGWLQGGPAPACRRSALGLTRRPLPGARTFDGDRYRTPTAYGSSKLMGERAVAARMAVGNGCCTGVNVRIGWVQPGENRPATLGLHGGGDNRRPRPTRRRRRSSAASNGFGACGYPTGTSPN